MSQLFDDVPAEINTDPILDAALSYAAQGIYVFPVRLGVRGDGKKDVYPIASWKEASTRDPEVIRGWLTGAWRGQAIAADCGKSGIVVIDQDVADGKRGPDIWDEIGQKSEGRVRTPSGGRHDWFRPGNYSDSLITVDNSGAVGDGIDVRGQGGFVFLPPSADPRGGSWQWETEPDFAELPDVPPIVTERMTAIQSARRVKPDANPLSAGQLFEATGGPKTKRAAFDLLAQEIEEFAKLTEPGSSRSHIVAQRLGVLAGHGVDVFWTYQFAFDAIMAACEANGFVAAHGVKYVTQQIARGLDFGSMEMWTEVPEAYEMSAVQPVQDDVAKLLAEMLTADDMESRPAPEYLIKGLLNLNTISWVIGAPESKKSFVVLDMAASIVRGVPWQGRKIRQGKVVILAAEGAGGMSKRVKAYQRKHGQIGAGLYVLPMPVQAADIAAWAVLREACAQIGPVMVVIDTQARVTVGLDENTTKDSGVYISAVESIKKATGACVLTVHHTGRNGQDARGSSNIDGSQDTELKVIKSGPLEGKLKTEKQKDMDKAADVPLRFEEITLGQDEDGDPITSLVLLEYNPFALIEGGNAPEIWEVTWGKVQAQLIKVLRDQGQSVGLTKAEARAAIQERFYVDETLPKSSFYTAWNELSEKTTEGGESLVTVAGSKYVINPVAMSELTRVLPSPEST